MTPKQAKGAAAWLVRVQSLDIEFEGRGGDVWVSLFGHDPEGAAVSLVIEAHVLVNATAHVSRTALMQSRDSDESRTVVIDGVDL